ncbi:CrcB family protein [Rothia sp. ZJ932]|uniref:fluoride efflux transporter FluC n=1 Tax=Rothia sp. ZJ932 TaxID=2810516 RepID=UPI002105028C|nr:CrcB family protein [Rothia sp. ZJ932]
MFSAAVHTLRGEILKLHKIPPGAWVFVGGGAGAVTRYFILEITPWDGLLMGYKIPWDVLLINCVGAIALGFLTGYMQSGVRTGRTRPHSDAVRLGLGAGFLGGFTTYSTLAMGILRLTRGGSPASALFYASISLLLGFFLCWWAMIAGERFAHRTVGGLS